MKYKDKSTECSKKCRRSRRPGQRTCAECHAEYMRTRRADVKDASDEVVIERALKQVVKRRGNVSPEFQKRLHDLAMTVARQINSLNGEHAETEKDIAA